MEAYPRPLLEGSPRPLLVLQQARLPMVVLGEPPPLVSPLPRRTFPFSHSSCCVRARTPYWRRGLGVHSPLLLLLLHLCLMLCLMLTCSNRGLCSAAPVPTWRSADTNLTTVTWTQQAEDTEPGSYTTSDTTDDPPTFEPAEGNADTFPAEDSKPFPPQSAQRPGDHQLTSTGRSTGVKAEVTPEHPPQSFQARPVPVSEEQQGLGLNPAGGAIHHAPLLPRLLIRTGSHVSDVTTQPQVTSVDEEEKGEGETRHLLEYPTTLTYTLTSIPPSAVRTTEEVQEEEKAGSPPSPQSTSSQREDYTSVTDDDINVGFEGQQGDAIVTEDVTQVSDTTTKVVEAPDTIGWHSSPEPQHGSIDVAAAADDDQVGARSTSPRQLLTTMLITAHVRTTSQELPAIITQTYPPKGDDIIIDDNNSFWGNQNRTTSVDDLQFDLEDLILAVCGTAASTFTVCMLVTFTRCCCKKQKDDSDGEDASARRGHRHHHGAATASAASASSSSSHRSKSLWKRSWKRPLDSGATTATQESSTSADNITQVTIERRESYTDEQDSDLTDGYDEDDDEGGFTKGGRRKRHGDGGKSRKSHSKDSDDNATAPSVRDRIRAFEVPPPGTQGEVKVREGIKPRKNKPTSKAFSEFESKGILIGFGGPQRRHGEDEEEDEDQGGLRDSPLGVLLPSPTSGHSLEDTPTSSRGLDDDEGVHTMESEEDEFAAIQRSGEVLKSFRRAPPPRNRSRARKSGRGRRQIRGQDVSSSEQIAEEPSSGSFGSHPTSGINSPATSATPEEEEHETFEASLHMGTTESLSIARSSSISQTPQSSLDSMDSPKRQPSVSSRDSPKRLLDSPKRQQLRGTGDISPRRTPPLGPRSPVASLRPSHSEALDSGHSDFSLTIPVEFQQQRLGLQPEKVAPHSSGSGRPRRPMSYHVEPPSRGGATEKFLPLRPLSTHHDHPYHGVGDSELPSSTDIWPPPTSSPSTANGHEVPLRARDHAHLHELPSHNKTHLHEPRPCDSISLSHGHLGRDLGTPVGRVLPQVRGSASPVEMRRWESEHSYLQQKDTKKPSRLRKDARGRGRGQEPEPPHDVMPGSQSRQTLRPTPEDAQVRDHPQSEKLERKVLKMEPPPGTTKGPDLPNQSGGTGVQISEVNSGRENVEIPPPRPPLPSWRKMKPAYNTSNQFPLPPRQPKINLSTRSRSFHVMDLRERQSKSVDSIPNRGQSRYSGGKPDGLEYDITPDELRKTWDGMVRSRSLERPTKRLNAQFSPERYSNHYSFLDNDDELIKSNSLDVSPDQIRISQAAFSNKPRVVKSKSLEMSPERLSRHHQWRNIETELSEPSYDEVDNVNDGTAIFRPLPSRKSWHGNTKSPQCEKPQMRSALGDVPWLREKDDEESQNLKPSDIRKSMRDPRNHSSSVPTSNNIHAKSGAETFAVETFKDHTTVPQNRSIKTERQVTQMSLDFKRNVPQSQSVRSPKSPPDYRMANIRYSMRDRLSNWRNVRDDMNSHCSQPKEKRPEVCTKIVPEVSPIVHNPAETHLPNKVINHQIYTEEPLPPRPPLPTENPLLPLNHRMSDISAPDMHKTMHKTAAAISPAGLPTPIANWGPKYRNPNQSYRSEDTPLKHNQYQFQGMSRDLHRPPSVDVPPNLVTPEGSLKRQTSLRAQQLAKESIATEAMSKVTVTASQLGREKYWSMERPSFTKKGQPTLSHSTGLSNLELDKVSRKPDIVENIKLQQKSESEQPQRSQILGDGPKQGFSSSSDWSAQCNHAGNAMASGHTYVDMTQNLRTDHFSEVSASPHRPRSTHDELSPVPLSCTFSEPSPVPSDLPPSDHVLRFTRDPRWKESLVKPEAKSMYEVMHGQDSSNMPGFPYTFTPEDRILEAMPSSLLRDTPDVVPISERRISPRVTSRDNELQFTFNFDAEATEI